MINVAWSLRHVHDDHSFGKMIRTRQQFCYIHLEMTSRKNVYRAQGRSFDWYLSILSVQDSLMDSAADGKDTIMEDCVNRCIVVGRAPQQAKYPRLPELHTNAWSCTSFSRNDMTFGRNVSIAT